MIDDGRLRAVLAEAWGLTHVRVRVHNGGMNSATWFVSDDHQRWVAKAVGDRVERFAAGLWVAAQVDAAGVPTGAPVPTVDGRLAVDVDGTALALLTWVDGHPLTAHSVRERELVGRALARVHRVLAGTAPVHAQRFHWLDLGAPHLDVRPWIRPAVAAAVSAYERLGPESLTWGGLHGDPAPEAFRYEPATGVCGLIDWPTALVGPLMYDVASAVMYVGGRRRARPLLDAYLRHGPLAAAEVERSLPVMQRLRWAVQADYFARRIHRHDLTGIRTPADNETGLEHARRHLVPPPRTAAPAAPDRKG